MHATVATINKKLLSLRLVNLTIQIIRAWLGQSADRGFSGMMNLGWATVLSSERIDLQESGLSLSVLLS